MNTQPDMLTLFALSFTAGMLVIVAYRALPRLRLGTRLRNVTRRLLGLEDFEALTLDELRNYRRDVDNWSRSASGQVRRNANAIASVRQDTAIKTGAQSTSLRSVRNEVEELGVLLRRYTDALGPMWTTAQGHSMPLRLLSTGHLKNILEGGFARSLSVADFIETELERRRIDTGFRVDAQNGKPAPTRQDMVLDAIQRNRDATREIIGTRLALAPATMERVTRVLPVWAANIVRKLRERDLTVMTPSNRRRVKGLPQWAQVTIADLLRRAK